MGNDDGSRVGAALAPALSPEEKVPAARVSVVIPVHDDGETIGACLRSVLASSCPVHELIVVDDGSTDDSAEVIARFPCALVRLGENEGVARARNAGARLATGDVLFYTDGDVTLRPDTIAVGVRTLLEQPDVAAVMGSYARECGPANFCSTYKNLLHHYTHQVASRETCSFIGCCGMVRREVFEAVGGFDEAVFSRILEDADLGYRMHRAGHRILLVKGMQVVHHKVYTLPSLIRSDVVGRAIPWTRLILRHRLLRFDLCTRVTDLLSLALAYLILPGVLLAVRVPWLAGLVLVLLVAFVAANSRLYRFFWRERGPGFAALGIGMHYLYFLYAGVGLLLGVASFVGGAWRPSRSRQWT